MKEDISSHKSSPAWPLLLAWLFAFLAFAGIIISGLKGTGGVFTYPVDDTYIHLKIAKNLAVFGNWGINPGEFNSASSSLLYTLLLAALIKIFPDPLLIPLIVNAVAGTVLLILVWKWLKKQMFSPVVQCFILLLAVFFTPLPVLMLSGMEHVLQCIFVFVFLTAFVKWLHQEGKAKLPWKVIIFSILLVATRYEGLFIIAGACVILLTKKRISQALVLAAFAFLPVIIFGLISVMKGSYFFPNSILVKSEAAQFSLKGLAGYFNKIIVEKFMFAKAGITLLATQRLLLLLPLVWIISRKKLSVQPGWSMLLIILTIASFLQLALADTGKFYRYEAYLVLLSVIVIGIISFSYAKDFWSQETWLYKVFSGLVIAFLVLPLLLRTLAAFTKAPRAIVNIYEQQYQMARFLQEYYPMETVAANDIGAISYFRDGKITDLWGLGTIEVARSKKAGSWNAAFLNKVSREKKARFAIIYESWIGEALPPQWIKLANWKIQNNVVAGDDNVSFFAIDPAIAIELKQHLSEFQKQLPPTVTVAYY